MVHTHLVRSTRRAALGLAAAFVLLAGAQHASADEIQTFPGSACQASGSAQDLYYSSVSVANRGNGTRSAVCPIVRTNGTAAWVQIHVFVRDRHSTGNVTCVAEARSLTGVLSWTQTRAAVGEGEQTLIFNAPAAAVPDYGPYVLICSIPPMEEVN